MIHLHTQSMNPVQKVLTSLLGIALVILGIMFSVVVIPVIAVTGALALGYVYWRTRALRKAMAQARAESNVIEGEAVVVREEHEINRFLN